MYAAITCDTYADGLFLWDDALETWHLAYQGTTGQQPMGVRLVAIDPTDPWTVYFNDGYHFLKSTDGVRTWPPIMLCVLPGLPVSIAISNSNPDVIFLGTYDGLARSIDGGHHFDILNNGIMTTDFIVWAVAIDPNDNNVVYAGGEDQSDIYNHIPRLYKSTNGGNSWSEIPLGAGWWNPMNIAFHPLDSNTIFVTTEGQYLHISYNGGDDWTRKDGTDGLTSGNVDEAVFNPQNPEIVYVNTLLRAPGGVYLSGNEGASWIEINEGLDYRDTTAMAISPSGGVVFVATGERGPGGVGYESRGVYRRSARNIWGPAPDVVPREGHVGDVVHATVIGIVPDGDEMRFVTRLPPELSYIDGSFMVDGAPATPVVAPNEISYVTRQCGDYLIEFDLKVARAYWEDQEVSIGAMGIFYDWFGNERTRSGTYSRFTLLAVHRLSVLTTTESEEAVIGSSAGIIGHLSAVDPGGFPNRPPGIEFPHGMFRIAIGYLDYPGQTVTVYIELPADPIEAWWKYHPNTVEENNGWASVEILSNEPLPNDRILITIELTDNEIPDDDEPRAKTIVDPGGPAFIVPQAVGGYAVPIRRQPTEPTACHFAHVLLAVAVATLGYVKKRKRNTRIIS